MKRFVKGLVWFVAIATALRILGELAARRFESGNEESDEVRLAAIWGGRDFHSTSAALSSVWGRVILGGINLDLTDATLHPDGASIDLDVRLGGVNLTVPAAWRVDVDDSMRAGGVAVQVPEHTDDDAPPLRVAVRGSAGGVNVEAKH
jgi:hypothetical protein